MRKIGGKPLIAWSIGHALACPKIDRCIVSTDGEDIAATASEFGAEVPFMRPAELADDNAATDPVLVHAVERLGEQGYIADAVVLLQPTSPIREADALSRAIEQFMSSGADSLVSVCQFPRFIWKNRAAPSANYDPVHRPRRQDIGEDEMLYLENGSIYITKTEMLRETGSRLCGQITMFEMSERESLEIDTALEFDLAATLMEQGGNHDH